MTSTVPLGAFAHLLKSAPALDADLGGGASVLRGLQRAHQELRERAGDLPLLLLVDDAQCLDEVSAALTLQLAATGVTVLATVRSGDPVPDEIVRLWKDGYCGRLELQPLSRQDVERMLTATLGPLDDATTAGLWAATLGNPLLLRELVLEAIGAGTLREVDGAWRWDGTVHAGPRLVEIIDARIGKLSAQERDGVAVVALGEPLMPVTAAAMIPAEVLASLEARQILGVDTLEEGAVRLAHPLYGEVVRARMGRFEAAAVRRRLADAVGSSPVAGATDRLRVVLWQLDAGEPAAVDALVDAADTAYESGDSPLAERLARAAMERDDGPAARTTLGRALAVGGRPEEAEHVLRPVLDDPSADDSTRAVATTWSICALAYGEGRIDAADAVVARALPHIDDDSARALVQGQWATTLAYTGRWREAGPIAEPLLEHPDLRVRLRALSAATLARLSGGDCPAALASATDLLSSAYAAGETYPSGVRWASVSLISVYLHDARLAELRALLDAAEFEAVANGPNRASLMLVRGRLALAQGHAASARAALRDAVAQLEVVDAEGWSPWAYALLAEAEALLGDEHAARAAARESETSRAGVQIYMHDAARARARGPSSPPVIRAGRRQRCSRWAIRPRARGRCPSRCWPGSMPLASARRRRHTSGSPPRPSGAAAGPNRSATTWPGWPSGTRCGSREPASRSNASAPISSRRQLGRWPRSCTTSTAWRSGLPTPADARCSSPHDAKAR